MSQSLQIALVAGVRYPIAEPFAGGMEAHTSSLAALLTRRGHDVTVFAGRGSDPGLGRLEILDDVEFAPSARARADVSMPPEQFLREHHAYQRLMLRLGRVESFDVVHLNCLHYLPVAMADLLPQAPLLTLHTPPTPWLESALHGGRKIRPVAVSRSTADAWRPMLGDIPVIGNGVDLDLWSPGPGGPHAVWSGRLVPEKGAHLAIDAAAEAGISLVLAGPASNPGYFRQQIAPRLGGGGLGHGAIWVGHLGHRDLVELVGRSAVCLVTPCWEEPFGLVVAESLAVGTPVAAFDRGALSDLLSAESGRLCAPGDVSALAAAIRTARRLDRRAVRARAEQTCDVHRMVDGYVRIYRDMVDRGESGALSNASVCAVQPTAPTAQMTSSQP
ncbi:MAG: glycosyltransferase [Geodermatophilaceae bacterium]|nr:glycosyltransferase [Geodermatophilaceae bacterium]